MKMLGLPATAPDIVIIMELLALATRLNGGSHGVFFVSGLVNPLTAREVYQVLRDVALGTRTMQRVCSQSWNEIHNGHMPVEIDGWMLTLFNDCDTLDYCENCRAPDGRVGTLEAWQRYGTDPVDLLSGWEREQLERLLNALCPHHLLASSYLM